MRKFPIVDYPVYDIPSRLVQFDNSGIVLLEGQYKRRMELCSEFNKNAVNQLKASPTLGSRGTRKTGYISCAEFVSEYAIIDSRRENLDALKSYYIIWIDFLCEKSGHEIGLLLDLIFYRYGQKYFTVLSVNDLRLWVDTLENIPTAIIKDLIGISEKVRA